MRRNGSLPSEAIEVVGFWLEFHRSDVPPVAQESLRRSG